MRKLLAALTSLVLLLAVAFSVTAASFVVAPAMAADSVSTADIPLDPFAGIDSLPSNPMSEEAFHTVFLYAAKNKLTSVTISYSFSYQKSHGDNIAAFLKESLCEFSYRYPEYFNYLRHVSFNVLPDNCGFSIVLKFASKGGDTEAMLARRDAADARAREVYNSLPLTDEMTEKQRARVILDWVCENVSYEDDGTLLCHTAYGALENGVAVCDGYSALYQTLLRLDGIRCWGQKGVAGFSYQSHHWTVAVLDGQVVNIDAAWSDTEDCGDRFFAVSDTAFSLNHSW